jgi:uncharacterized protein (UPF0305 family)
MFRSDPDIVWKKKDDDDDDDNNNNNNSNNTKKKKVKKFLKWKMQIDVRTSGYNSIFSQLTHFQEQYAVHPTASRFPSVHSTLNTKPTHRFMFPHYLTESYTVAMPIRIWYVNSD